MLIVIIIIKVTITRTVPVMAENVPVVAKNELDQCLSTDREAEWCGLFVCWLVA